LSTYPMPPPDRPVVAALTQPDRCLVTPEPGKDPAAFLRRLEAVLLAGVQRVQLRARKLDARALAPLANEAKQLCDSYQAELLINGEPELAAELGCGLHLRAEQLMACAQRPVPATQRLSASCHDAAELAQAQAIGVDFALLGPVRATASHPQGEPIDWTGFARLREAVSLPIYALGGMRGEDIEIARRHGAQGIAAIRGLWPSA
jgi:8-oxo-dGTP diphosphatase